jgi:RNA polymerase sigma-70 factor, ECF subfamily
MTTRETTLEDTRSGIERSTSADEQLLVAQAKSGHSGAFGELYERYRLKLYHSAFRILRNRQDAEDAVQRSFQRAFTNLIRFREDSTFSTWMTRIAINEALMLLRQRRIHSSISRAQDDDANETSELNVADERPTPEQVLAQNELRDLVTWAISRLRGKLRSVVLLRELQGLTNAETARRLGLTISAVKGRTFHARRHLRRHLAKKYRLHRGGRRPQVVAAKGMLI